jgi:hypothetical protein
MILPIFIHVREKSEKELREEMERDARMRKAIEKDEARERERKRLAEFEKQQKIKAERKRLEDEYYKAKEENPWDFQFMPEGWSIFGQTYITPIDDI